MLSTNVFDDLSQNRDAAAASNDKKWWGTAQRCKPEILICFSYCYVIAIASMIVLALIPVYLPDKELNGIDTSSNTDLLILSYGTDLNNATFLTVANIQTLTKDLMNALHLTRITVINAYFVSQLLANNTRNARAIETNNMQCLRNINSTGDWFVVTLSIEYPQICRTAYCKTRYLAEIHNNIDTVYYKIYLQITFTNGQTLGIQLIFCLYGQPPTGSTPSEISTEGLTPAETTTKGTTPAACNFYNIARMGDFIYGVYNTSAGHNAGGDNGEYTVPSEEPPYGIDNNVSTKYINLGNGNCSNCIVNQPGNGTGFVIIPSISNATVVQGLQFATANDAPNRDPVTVTLEGSNKTNISELDMGSSWTLIYSGLSGISAYVDPGRFTYGTQQNFSNTNAFASYRLLITSQRGSDVGVQYSEVRILGTTGDCNAINFTPNDTFVDITRTNDTIVGLYNTTAGQDTGGRNGEYTVSSEEPPYAIDSNVSTKYVNLGNGNCSTCTANQPGVGTGFLVTPSISSATVARALLFATANDAPNRDPITVTLEGSNATTNSALDMGSSWTLIYNGTTGISVYSDPGRLTYGMQQTFPNTMAFASYRLLVTLQRGNDIGVQYSEARILGFV